MRGHFQVAVPVHEIQARRRCLLSDRLDAFGRQQWYIYSRLHRTYSFCGLWLVAWDMRTNLTRLVGGSIRCIFTDGGGHLKILR